MSNRSNLPLLNTLQDWATQSYAPFHTPGHKKGQSTHPKFAQLVGATALQADLPELPELDNLFAPQGVIKEAQDLAAQTFGADQTWFLANGSTSGIIAAILATCVPGDTIVVPRNLHQSVIAGIILAGVNPVFVMPEYDRTHHLAHGITAAAIAEALTAHPETKAVLIVYPTYYGVCSHIADIIALTHRHQIPLIVDEAHGAHFHFHPALPTSAMAAGADITIQSTHKTLAAMTQASMLHMQGDRVSPDRLSRALALVQSTSPNYLLLASLDAARAQMAECGEALLSATIARCEAVKHKLQQLPQVQTLTLTHPTPGFWSCDQTRLTVAINGIDGFTADEILTAQHQVICELPTLEHLTFIFTSGTTPDDADRLIAGITQLSQQRTTRAKPIGLSLYGQASIAKLSPREAFFAPTQTVTIDQGAGQVSAELVCPYPPGIPVLLPGEVITTAAIEFLQAVQRAGGLISGCQDAALNTIQIIPT